MTKRSQGLVLLGLCLAATLLWWFGWRRPAQTARFRLPVGAQTPEISFGQTSGIILASNGSLWSWGTSPSGAPVLGLGSIKTRNSLCRVGSDTNWISVSMGDDQTLAVKSDGTLWGWGANYKHQLGDGTQLIHDRPTPSAPGHEWQSVVTGRAHTLAIKRDGSLWAWGDNSYGQLGLGVTNFEIPTPTQVGTATNWTKIAAGSLDSVGLQSDGTLWTWGDNSAMQGAFSISNCHLIPTLVSPDTNWVDATIGMFMMLGIKSDGTLWAWGRNAHAFTGGSGGPAIPARIGTETDWQACYSGRFYHLLRKKNGSLWIMDVPALAGSSSLPFHRLSVRWRKVSLPDDIAALGSGAGIGAAITRDGEVWTWGAVLGEQVRVDPPLQKLAKLINARFASYLFLRWGQPGPPVRNRPWRLDHMDSDDPAATPRVGGAP
jgi:alpha-tubulin suppressor-like RCC1 family protein